MPPDKCIEHSDRILKIEERLHSLDIQLTKIDGTTEHIKSRMDNGLSTTVTKIYDTMMTLVPKVEFNTNVVSRLSPLIAKIEDNSEVVGKVKAGSFWVVTMGMIGGLLSFSWHMFKKMLGG